MIQLIYPINLIGPGNEFEQKRTQLLEFQIGRNTVRRILRTRAQRRGSGHDMEIRIGEGLTIFAVLHHRAYESVHGGSCSLT